MRSASPPVTRTAPVASNARATPSSRLSGSTRGASAAAATPIGTLTNRTHSHPAHSVSTPPRSTPAAPPEPATAPQIALSETAEQRRRGEEDEADDEHAPATEEIGEAPTEKQKTAERQRVRVDDPGEIVLRELERGADGGQGDVDDRGVEDDHELRCRQQRQGGTLAQRCLLIWGHGASSTKRRPTLATISLRKALLIGQGSMYSRATAVANWGAVRNGPPMRAAIVEGQVRRGQCRARTAGRTTSLLDRIDELCASTAALRLNRSRIP